MPRRFLQLLSCYLALQIVGTAFLYPVVYVNFLANRNYIAEQLCINKDKPALDCRGCCQLKSQMSSLYQEQDSPKENKKEERPTIYEWVQAALPLALNERHYLLAAPSGVVSHLLLFSPQNEPGGIFRPPNA